MRGGQVDWPMSVKRSVSMFPLILRSTGLSQASDGERLTSSTQGRRFSSTRISKPYNSTEKEYNALWFVIPAIAASYVYNVICNASTLMPAVVSPECVRYVNKCSTTWVYWILQQLPPYRSNCLGKAWTSCRRLLWAAQQRRGSWWWRLQCASSWLSCLDPADAVACVVRKSCRTVNIIHSQNTKMRLCFLRTMYNMSYVHAHLCVHVCVRTCTLLSGQKQQGYVVFDSIKLSPPEQSSQGPFIAMVFYIWIFVSKKHPINSHQKRWCH